MALRGIAVSDNTTLNIGSGGDTIATEDTGLGYKLAVSKIRLGAKDQDGGDVTSSNPFPVAIVAADVTGALIQLQGVTRNGTFRLLAIDPDASNKLDAIGDTLNDIRDLLRALVAK